MEIDNDTIALKWGDESVVRIRGGKETNGMQRVSIGKSVDGGGGDGGADAEAAGMLADASPVSIEESTLRDRKTASKPHVHIKGAFVPVRPNDRELIFAPDGEKSDQPRKPYTRHSSELQKTPPLALLGTWQLVEVADKPVDELEDYASPDLLKFDLESMQNIGEAEGKVTSTYSYHIDGKSLIYYEVTDQQTIDRQLRTRQIPTQQRASVAVHACLWSVDSNSVLTLDYGGLSGVVKYCRVAESTQEVEREIRSERNTGNNATQDADQPTGDFTLTQQKEAELSLNHGDRDAKTVSGGNESAAPNVHETENVDKNVEPEKMDVAIQVNYMARPVSGAMVRPEWYGGRGGNEWINVQPKQTDAKGIASFRLNKRYGENFETTKVHVAVRHADFCYRYEHNAPIENGVVTLSLTKGYRVLADAIAADTHTPITYDIYSGDSRDGLWHRQSDGRLLSPMFRHGEYGNRGVGLTQIRSGKVVGFSDLVPVRPRGKQRQVVATKIPIHRPVSLSGELDSNVPRPVKKGRVMVVVRRLQTSKSGKAKLYGPDWVDWTPIDSDGTFRFDALPRGGEVSLLATCDDKFVSSTSSIQGMGQGITPGMFLGYLQPMKIQLRNEDINVKISMRPMTSARVHLLDPDSQPVVGAIVMARSHHSWNSSLGQPLFQSLRTRDMLLGHKPGPNYREPPSGITEKNGIATLTGIIPGSYMVTVEHPTLEMRPNPATPHVRDVDVKFPGGKVNELTIKLVPKGTTQLR